MEVANYIEKAKKGDQLAFTFLLNHYWPEVYGFMLKRIENEKITEDVTIETFAKAFDKIASYNKDYQFNTWLISIAKNSYIDILRKNKNNLFVDSNDDNSNNTVIDTTPTAEDTLITEQNLSELLRYIKFLKPTYQEVIQLRYFQEMSYSEMADKLQEPLSTIKIKLVRAKKTLAEIIIKNKS